MARAEKAVGCVKSDRAATYSWINPPSRSRRRIPDAGVDPVSNEREQGGTADEELLLGIWRDEAAGASLPQRGGVQSGEP
jgi:hypothetical protein